MNRIDSKSVYHVAPNCAAGRWSKCRSATVAAAQTAASSDEGQESIEDQALHGPADLSRRTGGHRRADDCQRTRRSASSTKTARRASSARSPYYSDNHFEADGTYREFYPNGKLFVEGQFRNGRQDGEWTFYYRQRPVESQGDVQERQARRRLGRLRGPTARFPPSAAFADGQRDGEWITYDDDRHRSRCAKSITSTASRMAFGRTGIPTASSGNRSASSRVSVTAPASSGTTRARSASRPLMSNGKLHGTRTLWLTDGRKIVQNYEDGKLVSQSTE